MQFHQPVMVRETLQMLAPRPGGIMIDATVGTGGHSLAILPHLLPSGRLIAMDRDAEALAIARQRLAEFAPHVTYVHSNFSEMGRVLNDLHLRHVDGLIADLGMSSVQVDEGARGLSFSRPGPLDMRMDRSQEITAAMLLESASEEDLATMFVTFGEERFARRIARQIVQTRRRQPVQTTTQLAELIWQAVPSGARHGRLHPATRVFQALRMAVND